MKNNENWCPGEDSNLHELLHWYLKPARLPVPPPGHDGVRRSRGAGIYAPSRSLSIQPRGRACPTWGSVHTAAHDVQCRWIIGKVRGMTVTMPPPDARTLASRAQIAGAMREIVPGEGVIDHLEELAPYESDGLTAYAQKPLLVVLPENTAQISAILRWCNDQQVKVVPRGAGTSLSGGALPLEDGILLGLSRLNKILDIDYDNRAAVVQPGVTNLAVSQAVAARGFYYAPDPSSQIACTIGGNVAENSGGVHCLKYGMTAHNVLGAEDRLDERRSDRARRQGARRARVRLAWASPSARKGCSAWSPR